MAINVDESHPGYIKITLDTTNRAASIRNRAAAAIALEGTWGASAAVAQTLEDSALPLETAWIDDATTHTQASNYDFALTDGDGSTSVVIRVYKDYSNASASF